MALAKDNHQIPSSRCFYENMLDVGSSIQQFPHIISPYTYDEYDQHQYGDDGLESPNNSNNINNNTNKVMISPTNHVISNNSPTISNSSTSANSSNNGLTINHHNTTTSNNFHQSHEEAHSLINFKPGFGSFMDSGTNNNGSLLSFRNENNQFQLENNYHNNYPMWEGNYHHQQQQQRQQSPNRYQLKEMKNCNSNTSLLEEVSHLRTSISDYNQDLGANDWIYAEANVIDPPQESATQQTRFDKKRANMEEESMQPSKKKCTANTSKKPKFVSKLKDPQSVAAKNRRERISERLKILQDLVPNGSKVDLVTMLEKAIGYVKFLQLQLKVLATDEFWPAAGGNAPDISQVKEAIDAILSSQRSSEGTTSSTSK